jgi:hypothetical protein
MAALIPTLSLQGIAVQILIHRRQAVIGAAAALSLLPLREAVAQTAARGGDWLAMVKAHHALVAKTFDAMLASGNTLFERRRRMQRTLAYQLTAHSVAEENVIYPALATAGLISESDKLYLDQAHTKVMNAQLELSSLNEQGPWMEKVRCSRQPCSGTPRKTRKARSSRSCTSSWMRRRTRC